MRLKFISKVQGCDTTTISTIDVEDAFQAKAVMQTVAEHTGKIVIGPPEDPILLDCDHVVAGAIEK